MKTAKVVDFQQTIKSLDIPELKIFMIQMLKLCSQEQHYESYFGTAMNQFIVACHNISQDSDSGRLGTLIERLFDQAKLSLQIEAKGNK